MPEYDPVGEAAHLFARAARVVVSTGAGMSKESGIPTFRDAPNALWAHYDPQKLATREGFRADPALVWNWYAERRRMISRAGPHAGHYAIAELETLVDDVVLLTQNIDDLHRKAGSRNVVEIHGNIFRYKCFDRHHTIDALPEDDRVPPRCRCGSPIRPDIVWFGEMLDEAVVERAYRALASCDAMLVVGTSGTVHPAAGFPDAARAAGARVVEINPEETPITPRADIFVRGTAANVLPDLVVRINSIRDAGGTCT